ncbi:MAG: ABC transporter substrate-binding protein [Oscillospiraceae bacterium]|nr:ABC transporter substrate-binding protein [Oscillospiraceae bacterium]MBQ2998391.1 ABC transporter substrate-binding protein [Oscillospiraceae bacterium]
MKKIICVLMALVMMLAVSGCSGESDSDVVKIGVIQFMQHASLDEAYQGFVDGLAEAGYVEGENLKIDFQNASGEVSNCQQICDIFANSGIDLALAIATPAAQSAVNVFQETDVPVFFTAVTDAVGAGLVESNEAPGKNVTGTLDMPVIADQIAVIKDVLPDAQKLAILYTSSEPNSAIQADEAKLAAEALGMEVIIQTSSSSNDIPQVISSVVGSADAIYIPSDNAFASAMATVNHTAVENQIPVFCAVEAMIAEGGIATTAIDYYELGKQTAAQAVRVLNGESASEIAVETQKECALVVNKTFAESVGVEVPAEIIEKAATVY